MKNEEYLNAILDRLDSGNLGPQERMSLMKEVEIMMNEHAQDLWDTTPAIDDFIKLINFINMEIMTKIYRKEKSLFVIYISMYIISKRYFDAFGINIEKVDDLIKDFYKKTDVVTTDDREKYLKTVRKEKEKK